MKYLYELHKVDLQSEYVMNGLSYRYLSHTHTQTHSEFNTIVDIELHKWAESLQLASLCADVGMATMFDQLRKKMTSLKVNTLTIH